MSTSQAVFLFDICAFAKAETPEQLQKALRCLRRVCLRLITELSERIPSFRFGFKFFNSKDTVTQISDRFPLSEVNLEAFENLETEICRKYERYATQCKVVAESVNSAKTKINDERILTLFGNEHNLPVKVLNLILTQTLCEFQWDSLEISSPVRNHKSRVSQNFEKNYVFLISSSPTHKSSLVEYFGVKNVSNAESIKQLLMPPALYEKFVIEANISLLWLDTTCLSYINNVKAEKSSLTEIFRSALNELCGALIPLQVLAESNLFSSKNLFKVSDIADEKSTELSLPGGAENLQLQKNSSFFLPFSSLFSHYLSGNHRSRSSSNENSCSLLFPNKLSVKIQLLPATTYSTGHLNMCNKTIPSSPGPKQSRRSCVGTKNLYEPNVKWCNFVCEHTVPQSFYGNPDSTFICLPVLKKSSDEQFTILQEINKILLEQNQYLVLRCETKAGFRGIGIFSPFSEASSTISIFAFTPVLLYEKITTQSTKETQDMRNFVNERKERLLKCLENVNTGAVPDNLENCATYKAFDMTSVERWFIPTSKVCGVVTEMKEKCVKRKKSSTGDFLWKLHHHYKANNETPRKKINPGDATYQQIKTGIKNNHLSQNSEDTEIPHLDFKNEDDVREHLIKMYDSVVSLDEPIFQSAQSLINVAVDFFKAKESMNNSNDAPAFINKHILAASSEISQKYNDRSDSTDIRQKIREYQLQVILHLELVTLSSSAIESCVNKVMALLRALSFVIGPFELSQFLRDTVVGNYSSNLHHLLVEIGEELDMPIVPDLFSPSSASDMETPEKVAKSSTLSQNSVPSWQSASTSSQHSVKGSSLNRRSVSGNFKINQTRQIMVPTRLLRKHKISQKSDPHPIRKSPRLAIKNNSNDSNQCTNMKASKICRNLFNVGVKQKKRQKSVSPEKGNCKRRKLLTPKGHHTLKTNYVPETPSPKQGSSFQRRMARLSKKTGAISEVMESPVSGLDKGAHTSRLNMLRNSGSFYGRPSSSEYESNKEQRSRPILLSKDDDKPKIKPSYLFSEILCSPKANHPSTRCSKRLFQNYTPQKTYPNTPKSEVSPPKTPKNQPNTHPSTPKTQPSPPKTPSNTCPSTPKAHSSTSKTQLSALRNFPSTPLKSILKRTPSKEIKNCNLVKEFSSPISAVVLSLPMHAFPTPDKSISPINDSEDAKIKTAEMTNQSIRNRTGQCPSSVNDMNTCLDTPFASQQQNYISHLNNTALQNSRTDYNQTDTSSNKPFQLFSSLGKKAISKTHRPQARDRHSQRLQSNKGVFPIQPNFVSENARLPDDLSFPGKANDLITLKEDTTQTIRFEMKQRMKKAFTDYIESPKKAAKSVSFGFVPDANCEDPEPPSQFKDLGNVYTPPHKSNTIASVRTPVSTNKKLYTPPTTSSLLHLSTSPVVFTKKTTGKS